MSKVQLLSIFLSQSFFYRYEFSQEYSLDLVSKS